MTVSWLSRALTLGVLAIILPLTARGLYGPPGASVIIRWQSSVDATERQRLETEWQLVDGQEVSPSTWSYELTAPSEGRFRAIVTSRMRRSQTPTTSTGSDTRSRPTHPGPPAAMA